MSGFFDRGRGNSGKEREIMALHELNSPRDAMRSACVGITETLPLMHRSVTAKDAKRSATADRYR
jgi:hypothetical protein